MSRDVIDFDIGNTILSTYDENGFLGVGVDVPGGDQSGTSTFSVLAPFGTFSRPRDPSTTPDGIRFGGATALYGYMGSERFAWAYDDVRVTPKLPQASKGSWGAYADTGRSSLTVMVLDGTTGSFALVVPHSTSGATSVFVDVETVGQEEFLVSHGGGCELRVKATEAIVGDTALALALAKANTVDGIIAALQTLATGLSGLTGPLAPLQALGTALQGSLAALPPTPTTKLRSE